jgi:hypothetical protein
VSKYILVFLAGFITAVYCLAPPVDQAYQPGQQQANPARTLLVRATTWVANSAVHIVRDLACRLWVLVEARFNNHLPSDNPAESDKDITS